MLNICVTTRKISNPNYNESYSAISDDWLNFLNRINVNAILAHDSIIDPVKFFRINNCKGLILTNGENSSLKFDMYNKPKGTKRDMVEYKLMKICVKENLPILGVCRGHQFINLFFKGKLSKIKDHINKYHKVNIIYNINQKNIKNIVTNSFHENNIKLKNIGKGLKPWAVINDNVEGMYHINKKIIGIMWHPERYKRFKNFDINLFKYHFKIK